MHQVHDVGSYESIIHRSIFIFQEVYMKRGKILWYLEGQSDQYSNVGRGLWSLLMERNALEVNKRLESKGQIFLLRWGQSEKTLYVHRILMVSVWQRKAFMFHVLSLPLSHKVILLFNWGVRGKAELSWCLLKIEIQAHYSCPST